MIPEPKVFLTQNTCFGAYKTLIISVTKNVHESKISQPEKLQNKKPSL